MAGVTVVGQSGGVTPVINASLAGVIDAAQAAGPVIGLRHGVRGLLENDLVPLDRFDAARLARLRATPGAYLGSCRYAPDDDEIDLMLERLAAVGARRFIYIGGNDSAATSARLHSAASRRGEDLAIISVPKTIDNDLPCMDHTPGFPSAAAYVSLCARLLWLDSRSMRREEPLRVIEVKGRHSGWLTAACAQFVPEGGVIVLAPERAINTAELLRMVGAALGRHGCALVAVSEHAAFSTDMQVDDSSAGYSDAFGHRDSDAPGAWLRNFLQRETGRRCRLDALGALQKVALLPANSLDRDEAFAAGAAAMRAALAGESGICITLERAADARYAIRYGSAPLAQIAATERLLPDAFLDPSGQPSEQFRAWLSPLVAEAAAQAAALLDDALT
jgi:ATP-dependent phosphofructokinase / diphosphate-dependent phosphofructokinase